MVVVDDVGTDLPICNDPLQSLKPLLLILTPQHTPHLPHLLERFQPHRLILANQPLHKMPTNTPRLLMEHLLLIKQPHIVLQTDPVKEPTQEVPPVDIVDIDLDDELFLYLPYDLVPELLRVGGVGEDVVDVLVGEFNEGFVEVPCVLLVVGFKLVF